VSNHQTNLKNITHDRTGTPQIMFNGGWSSEIRTTLKINFLRDLLDFTRYFIVLWNINLTNRGEFICPITSYCFDVLTANMTSGIIITTRNSIGVQYTPNITDKSWRSWPAQKFSRTTRGVMDMTSPPYQAPPTLGFILLD
jgi:hypothetical protein